MEITWFGHSCFRIRNDSVAILTDPFAPDLGITLPPQRVNLATFSNFHTHHSYHDALLDQPAVLDGPGEYEIAGLHITGLRTPLLHNSDEGDEGTELWNTVFRFEIEGLVLCHLGDLSEPLSRRQVENLMAPDIVFVPAGGNCTLSPAQAAEVVARINPKVIIPMHYQMPKLTVELEPVSNFLREMGLKHEGDAQPRLNVTHNSLPEETKVIVLEPQSAD